MLRFKKSKGRYFRLTLQQPIADFRYDKKKAISLSEIEILEKGALIPAILSIQEKRNGLHPLTDGHTTEGTIIPLRAWVEGLTLRATLNRRLHTLQQDLLFSQRHESERLKFYIVTAIGIIALLVTLIWLIQLLSERRWRRVRDRIACDLHDEIGANASSLVHMTELIKETIPHPTTIQNTMLEEAIYTARITSRETRNFVQFLESEKSNFDINFQIGKIAQQLLGNTNYTCSLDVSKPLKKLNSSEQWDLLMFAKEALNNIAKHAQASHIDILTYLRDGRIELSISDNGKGIPQSNLPPRHLELRAKRLRAELVVEPLTETGTHIRLTLRK
jgi:signal transduction histidine kinase